MEIHYKKFNTTWLYKRWMNLSMNYAHMVVNFFWKHLSGMIILIKKSNLNFLYSKIEAILSGNKIKKLHDLIQEKYIQTFKIYNQKKWI